MKTLVIGGTGGLGRVIAEHLAHRGDRIGLLARTEARLREVEGQIRSTGAEVRGFQADILDDSGLALAFADYAAWSGGVDAVVFAASRFRAIGPQAQVSAHEWALDLSTSLIGAANVVRQALPLLQASSQPSLSLLVGPGHHRGQANASAYTSAQAGLVRLVECLGLELEASRIPVFAVFPGLTPAGQTQHLLESSEGRTWLPAYTEAFAEGKEVEPEVVATMITWLTEARPMALSGRTVFALTTPEMLELRLDRIKAEDRHRLRID